MDGLSSIVLSIILMKIVFVGLNDAITISTPSGKVKGFIMETPKGLEIAAFLGIPYGQPPVGKLRFKPPVKAKPWEGVFDGTKRATPCKQIIAESDEDCLNLSVYTPQINGSSEELYPVLAYIFGGAFALGESIPPLPQPLLDQNLVIVSMNYRIGVFGYATTLDEVLPGNYGQLDQILLLKWIQENIAYFGGDPKSVTLWGYSSGAMSTMANVLSPLSNGLIHRAIVSSGFSICKQTSCHTSAEFSKNVANKIDNSANTSQSIKDVLDNISPNDTALYNGYTLSSFIYNVDKISGFMPLVIDEMPYQPNVAKIPVMIGMLPNDGAFLAKYVYDNTQNVSDFGIKLRWSLENMNRFSSTNLDKTFESIMSEYNIQHPENMTRVEGLKTVMNVETDILYSFCCDTSIEILTKAGFPVYAYKFNHLSKLTTSVGGIPLGHGTDIQFVVSLSQKERFYAMTGSDLKTSQNMIEFWSNFAKYGNPNPVHSRPGEGDGRLVWRQWTLNNPGHMLLNESPSMEDGYFSNHTQFWKNHSMC